MDSYWRPRFYAGVDEPPIDLAARSLATTRRRAITGIFLVIFSGNTARAAAGKQRKRRCGKGRKRCPDGKCYARDKGCCPKKWGGGACWSAFPICCPPKPGHKRTSGCVADKAYCDGCASGEVECPANNTYPYNTCNPSGTICCPNSAPCPPDFPFCCPPTTSTSYGICLREGPICP